jgi:TonB-dependent receptor
MAVNTHGKSIWRSFRGAWMTGAVFMFMLLFCSAALARPAAVRGRVVDLSTGEPLSFVTVRLLEAEGKQHGTQTDLEGSFEIPNLAPGAYALKVSMIGYANYEVADLALTEEQTLTVPAIALLPETIQGEEIVVTAEMVKDSEAALLKDRQKASAVSDAISAEQVSRAAAGNAADAMEKVTGVAVVEGKYLYVRGLGDRYSNVRLNGASLASSDPDRNTVSMDIFPSKFLESIVTSKTFTPDQSGDFTGGSVNIKTTTFPDHLKISFSSSTSGNSAAGKRGQFLTYGGGGSDWLAKDDGTRAIPGPLADPNVEIPDIGSTFTNKEKALELDRLSKSFSAVMAPGRTSAPSYHSHALSLGNQIRLFDRQLGYFASVNYSKSYISYVDGVSAQYNLAGNVSETNELDNLQMLKDSKSSEKVLLGVLANFSYKPGASHRLHSTYIHNRSGESTSRYQYGALPRDLPAGTVYETRVLGYVQRALESFQLGGEHNLAGGSSPLKFDWTGSYSKSTQEEPDLRFFTNDYTVVTRSGVTDTVFDIKASNYSMPVRFYRNLNEDIYDAQANLVVPFSRSSSLKLGSSLGHKERTFRERRFMYYSEGARYDGDPETFFSDGMGILDSSYGFYTFGNYIVDASQLASNYDGDQNIFAAYGMVDLPVAGGLRLVTGARYETTRLNVTSQDTREEEGRLSNNDLLPSVNFVYAMGAATNVRAAYSKTLARPTFRELAPYSTFDYVGDFVFSGNPSLKRTLIDNYDVRWEWFVRPGELVAASAFRKDFTDPIERAIISINNEGQFQNVPNARVTGIEFEARLRLDHVARPLGNFQIGGNLTLIKSKVSIPPTELGAIRSLDPNAPDTRNLQGQSPYVINLDLGYVNRRMGTSVNAFYNIFGERLSEVSLGGSPNVFEKPRGMFDLNISQKLGRGISFGFAGKNLFDADVRKVQTYKGREYVVAQHKIGRTYKFGINYNL